MNNDWTAFRMALETRGDLFSENDAAKIPRIQLQNQSRWKHIQWLVKMVQKKDPELVVNDALTLSSIYERLMVVTKQSNFVIFNLDELLSILNDIDYLEGAFDFEQGTLSDYVKRIKQAYAIGREEYSWRSGQSPADFERPFPVGRLPMLPKADSDSAHPELD